MTLADVAQSVEHVLGKDGVTSSNLVISSMNKTPEKVSFSCLLCKIIADFSILFRFFVYQRIASKNLENTLATFLRHIGYTFFVTIDSRFTVFLLSFRDGLKLPDSTPLATFGYTLATLGYTKKVRLHNKEDRTCMVR